MRIDLIRIDVFGWIFLGVNCLRNGYWLIDTSLFIWSVIISTRHVFDLWSNEQSQQDIWVYLDGSALYVCVSDDNFRQFFYIKFKMCRDDTIELDYWGGMWHWIWDYGSQGVKRIIRSCVLYKRALVAYFNWKARIKLNLRLQRSQLPKIDKFFFGNIEFLISPVSLFNLLLKIRVP